MSKTTEGPPEELIRAFEWFARTYPKQWSQAAVCRWLANHPVVQKLLHERMQKFIDEVAMPNALRRQAEVEAMTGGKKESVGS